MERLDDLMVELTQMRYWLKKESPVGLLEDDSNVRKGKPPDWPDAPPPEPEPKEAPATPAKPVEPAPPRVDPVEEHLKYAEKYAKEHPFDLPGIRDLYLDILDHSAPGGAIYFVALKKVSGINSRMKDYYRRLRDEDPDQLDLSGSEERRLVFKLSRDLKSREPDIRLRAAEYLGLLGSGDGAKPLIRQVIREDEEKVRQMIFGALVNIGGSRVAKELESLRFKRDDVVLNGALDVLDTLARRSEVEGRYASITLGAFVFCKSEAAADRALQLLLGLKEKGLFGLVNAIGVREPERKLKIIRALGTIGDGRAASVLGNFLIYGAKGQLLEYRQTAMDALTRIGKPAVPYLAPFVEHPRCKQWAKYVLKQITGASFEYADQVRSWWAQHK
jgi:hypothetical protein